MEDKLSNFYTENLLKMDKYRDDLKNVKLFSFDLDGTIILDGSAIEGVEEFLDYLDSSKKIMSFLTNNSSKTNKMHAQKLAKIFQRKITENDVTSSLESLETYIEENGIKTAYPFVNHYIKKELRKYVEFSDENPEIVIVGFNTDANYAELVKVSELIFKGTPYILIHPDIRCPTKFGYIPDAGSFAQMIKSTTGKDPIWVGGKPNVIMIKELIKKYNVKRDEIAYIGDRLYTDVEMTRKSNIFGFLVLTGETSLKEFYNYSRGKEDLKRIFIVPNLRFLKNFLS